MHAQRLPTLWASMETPATSGFPLTPSFSAAPYYLLSQPLIEQLIAPITEVIHPVPYIVVHPSFQFKK
jgi:hypothetical protein